jgi:hypothetical protein
MRRLSDAVSRWGRVCVVMATLVLGLSPIGAGAGAQEVGAVRPNTLRWQRLTPGSSGRDVVRMQAYDHVGSPSCTRAGGTVAFDASRVVDRGYVSPSEIFVVRGAGKGLRRLTGGATPRWSPDSKRLLFMREGRGDPEKERGVFVINADGTGERRIGPGRWPDWSPDGSRIAFSMGGPDGGGARAGAKIYLANLDGSDRRVLCEGDCPSWSPDGRRIACCRVDPARPEPEIRLVDVATGREVSVGNGWYRADWSPDGKSVVCNGLIGRDRGMVRISVVDPRRPPEPLLAGGTRGVSPCFAGESGVVCVEERPRVEPDDSSHTFDGRYSIRTIDLTVVYLVPKDRRPLVDWRERVDYFMTRIQAFHHREAQRSSRLRIHVHPEPLIAGRTAEQLRGDNPDDTFHRSTSEARSALRWPKRDGGFPILLVLSEINWRELDDFRRTRVVDGTARFEGTVDAEGRHFPGAESGGARAVYDPEQGLGYGLVSADGWRVPYCGSDCVVYHEGIGHPIGLPHPEPIDDSVMGVAQYTSWINRTRVNDAQKRALGWRTGEKPKRASGPLAEPRDDLFTAFTAEPSPAAPRPREPVRLLLRWPEGAKLQRLKVSVQTDVQGPWLDAPSVSDDRLPSSVPIGSFDRPAPVSYRAQATLRDGQSVELRGYFEVKGAAKVSLQEYLRDARSFRRYLPAMKEPDLWQLAERDRTATVYRFIWMPSFHDMISARFVKTDEGAVVHAVRFRLSEDFRSGRCVERRSVGLKPAHWERIASQVERARFWELPKRLRDPHDHWGDLDIMDGDLLFVEGVREGRYHTVGDHSYPGGNFVDLCRAMLFMSGIDARKVWFEYRE